MHFVSKETLVKLMLDCVAQCIIYDTQCIKYATSKFERKFCIVQVAPIFEKKVQVGKDQEKAQSERDSHSKNRGGKKPN